MDITRRSFGGALGGVTVLLWLEGCGGADEEGNFVIGGNHVNGPHSIFITQADLDSPNGKTFDIIGQAQHNHTVTFTFAELQMLKAGTRIQKPSTFANDGTEHQHNVVIFAAAK